MVWKWSKLSQRTKAISALLLFVGIGMGAWDIVQTIGNPFDRKEEIIRWVRDAVSQDMAKDTAYQGLIVGEIALIKESSRKYSGYVEYKYGGDAEKAKLTVQLDGNSRIYNCDPPNALIMRKNVASLAMESNDNFAKEILRALATTNELYLHDNGAYATDRSVFALEGDDTNNLCDKEINGYKFGCSLSEEGYTFTAQPIKQGETGSAVYTVATGGNTNGSF